MNFYLNIQNFALSMINIPNSDGTNDIISINIIDGYAIYKIIGLYYNKNSKLLSFIFINDHSKEIVTIKNYLNEILLPLSLNNSREFIRNDIKYYIPLQNVKKIIEKLNDKDFELITSTNTYNLW